MPRRVRSYLVGSGRGSSPRTTSGPFSGRRTERSESSAIASIESLTSCGASSLPKTDFGWLSPANIIVGPLDHTATAMT